MATTKRHDVKDLALASEGVRRIEWADRQMPVLAAIRERFDSEQPLAGYRISACLHVTTAELPQRAELVHLQEPIQAVSGRAAAWDDQPGGLQVAKHARRPARPGSGLADCQCIHGETLTQLCQSLSRARMAASACSVAPPPSRYAAGPP